MVALAMDSQQDKLLMVLDTVTDARVFLIYNLQRMTTRGYRTRLVLPMRCWTVNHRTTRKGKPLPEKMSSQLQFRLNCSISHLQVFHPWLYCSHACKHMYKFNDPYASLYTNLEFQQVLVGTEHRSFWRSYSPAAHFTPVPCRSVNNRIHSPLF